MNILLLLFYLFMFNFFIVLLLLLCRVCYCDACKCLHFLGICVWFYQNKLMMMMMMMTRQRWHQNDRRVIAIVVGWFLAWTSRVDYIAGSPAARWIRLLLNLVQ